jgi:hypothetical protein
VPYWLGHFKAGFSRDARLRGSPWLSVRVKPAGLPWGVSGAGASHADSALLRRRVKRPAIFPRVSEEAFWACDPRQPLSPSTGGYAFRDIPWYWDNP